MWQEEAVLTQFLNIFQNYNKFKNFGSVFKIDSVIFLVTQWLKGLILL